MKINMAVMIILLSLVASNTGSVLEGLDLLTSPSTVSKGLGKMALRFYNGSNANTTVEVALKDGVKIMDMPGFDPSKKVLIHIHGFKENMFYESIYVIASAFLKRGDHNVIALDWSGYSTRNYLSAITACKFKVPQVADVIKQMVDRGIPLENFHVMGYSLGATCTGYVGRKFRKPKLKIITGLDPAGPIVGLKCFLTMQKGDAEFVQIIHTDRWVYGTALSCGDFNVFFNDNGKRFQPGCPFALVPFSYILGESCSHYRSWQFYTESVTGEAEYCCSICDNYRDFVNGKCENKPVTAAYGVNQSSRGYCYLETNAKAPYGRGLLGAKHSS